MNKTPLEQLMIENSAAKKKMIMGIVFTVIGMVLSYTGFVLMYVDYIYSLISLVSLPFFGVGIPFLIIGMIRTIKTNRAIAMLRMENNATAYNAVPVTAPTAVPVQPAAPVAEVPVQPAEAPAVQPEAVQAAPAAEYQPAPQPAATTGSAPFLDWRKYAPLDAGISYNANKDYKFHRADGFVGSVPQKFVDRTFPRCPICCSNVPNWTISQHNQMSWKGNLYLFKCSCCSSVISMSMPDVTTLANGSGGVVSNATVGLTNLMVKASSGKEAGAVYAVIESVGTSGIPRDCEGKEFKLEHMQDMYLRV